MVGAACPGAEVSAAARAGPARRELRPKSDSMRAARRRLVGEHAARGEHQHPADHRGRGHTRTQRGEDHHDTEPVTRVVHSHQVTDDTLAFSVRSRSDHDRITEFRRSVRRAHSAFPKHLPGDGRGQPRIRAPTARHGARMGGVSAPTDTARPSASTCAGRLGVRAQDDLYAHVNGVWIAEHEIPADRPIEDRSSPCVTGRVRRRATSSSSAPTQPPSPAPTRSASATSTPRSWTPTASRRWGSTPSVPTSTASPAWAHEELARGDRRNCNGAAPVARSASTSTPIEELRPVLVHLAQSGIGLPTSPTTARRSTPTPAAGTSRTSRACSPSSGSTTPTPAPRTVLDLETAIASHHWDVVRRRDADLTYNCSPPRPRLERGRVRRRGLVAGARRLRRRRRRRGGRAAAVLRPGARHAGRRKPSGRLGRLAAVAFVHSAAPYLTSAVVDEKLRVLRPHPLGHAGDPRAMEAGVGLVEAAVGFAVGQLYVERHFPPPRRPAWTSSSRTSSRPTAATSATSTG